ncbi:MAG: acyl-CoA carboxylase subunit epsilon [Pseudonocardiaceae bacterium]
MSGDTSHSSHLHSRVIHIARGNPSDEEIAALTAVVVSLTSTRLVRTRSSEPGQRSTWADPASRLRAPLRPGPGAWHASALPQ